MLASNNGDPRQCAANLLKLTRGENPYDRIKGIDAAITDAPSASARYDAIAEAEWVLDTYEPRVEVEGIDFEAPDAQGGDFSTITQGWKSKGNRHRRGYKAPLPPDCSQWIGIDRLRLGKCLRHCGSLYCCRLWLYCGGQNSQGKELGHKVRNRPDDPELGEVQKIHGTENRRRSRPLERDHKLGENLRS